MHILYSVQQRTHPGKVRENNEDAFGTALDWQKKLELSEDTMQQRGHLFAVADGMGGHAAGEVASQMAIEIIFTRYYTGPWQGPRQTLSAAIEAANEAIWEKANMNAGMSGMGTTLVAALYHPHSWLFANVGDSRAYLFRGGRIKQITKDHSWVAEQVNSGILTVEEAARHPFRNVITRSLGSEPEVQIDFFEQDAQPGDIALLCSDGLSNLVTEKEMGEILQTYALDEAEERLLELSLERGAPDNVTFLLIQLVGEARRHSRSFLPWLALGVTAFLILAFVYWNFIKSPESNSSETSIVALSTFTPISTPQATPVKAVANISSLTRTPVPIIMPRALTTATTTSPLPTPMLTARAAHTSAPLHILQKDALLDSDFTTDEDSGMMLVLGRADVTKVDDRTDIIRMEVEANGNDARIFQTEVEHIKNEDIASKIADGLVLVGYAQEGEGVIALSPILLLTPLEPDNRGNNRFQVIWQKDDGAVDVFLDKFQLDEDITVIRGEGDTKLLLIRH